MNPEINPGVAVVGPGAVAPDRSGATRSAAVAVWTQPHDHLTLQDGDALSPYRSVRTHPAFACSAVDLVFWRQATQIGRQQNARGVGRSRTVFASCRTGIEQLDTVRPYSPRANRSCRRVVPCAAQSDGSVRLRGEARLSLPDTSASRVVAAALQGTRCAVDLAANFSSLAWLMQNAVAGLMALTHRRSACSVALISPDLRWLICRECLAVARAEALNSATKCRKRFSTSSGRHPQT